MVETYRDAADAHDFHFAQVDCAANGDLCHAHDVKYYPSLLLYTDNGQHVIEFEERRTLSQLGKFVEEHYPVNARTLEAVKAAKTREDEEWSAKEQMADEQVGMGTVNQKKEKGVLGKARLPKVVVNENDEEEDGIEGKAAKPVLHIVDEPSSTSSSASASAETADDADADSSFDADVDADADADAPRTDSTTAATAAIPILTSQTPPATADSTAKFTPPAFVAQQRPGGEETCRQFRFRRCLARIGRERPRTRERDGDQVGRGQECRRRRGAAEFRQVFRAVVLALQGDGSRYALFFLHPPFGLAS